MTILSENCHIFNFETNSPCPASKVNNDECCVFYRRGSNDSVFHRIGWIGGIYNSPNDINYQTSDQGLMIFLDKYLDGNGQIKWKYATPGIIDNGFMTGRGYIQFHAKVVNIFPRVYTEMRESYIDPTEIQGSILESEITSIRINGYQILKQKLNRFLKLLFKYE